MDYKILETLANLLKDKDKFYTKASEEILTHNFKFDPLYSEERKKAKLLIRKEKFCLYIYINSIIIIICYKLVAALPPTEPQKSFCQKDFNFLLKEGFIIQNIA